MGVKPRRTRDAVRWAELRHVTASRRVCCRVGSAYGPGLRRTRASAVGTYKRPRFPVSPCCEYP
jgi:hypothetical protein